MLAIVAVVSGWVFIMNMVRTNQKVLTLWSQAQQLATDRQYQQAIETAGELIDQYPDSKQAISALDALVVWEAEHQKNVEVAERIDELLTRANNSFEALDLKSAIACAKELLAADPQNKEAVEVIKRSEAKLAEIAEQKYGQLFDTAQTLHFKDQWTQAIELYQQTLSIKYSPVVQTAIDDCYNNLYLQKARNARALDNLKLAVDYYSKALQYEDSQSTRDSISEVSGLLKKISEDLSVRERIEQLAGNAAAAQQNGELQTSIEFYKEAQSIAGDDAYKRSIDMCHRLIEAGKLFGNEDGQVLTVNIEDVSGSKTIGEAIGKASEGAVIFIGKGRYKEQLLTKVPLTLSSFGVAGGVSIEYSGQYVLKASSEITIKDIDFNLRANDGGEGIVIEINGRRANISNSTIQGGKNGIAISSQTVCNIYDNDLHSHSLSAISVKGEAVGKIENNRIEKCGVGIEIYGSKTNIVVTDNECIENSIGISIAGAAQGMIKQNVCLLNSTAGIEISGRLTKPTLENNRCSKNADGIIVKNGASGFLSGNICNENGQNGIIVTGNTTYAVIDSNRINKNQLHGILLTDKASARISGNLLSENEGSGISVSNVELMALIEMNRCLNNTNCGIKLAKRSIAEVISNFCKQNHYGILIEDDGTAPILSDNRCVENKYDGIMVSKGAKPTIQNNTASKNRYRGINIVGAGTTPTVNNNLATSNTKTGIYIGNGANPIIDGNTCSSNQYCGIEIQDPNTNPVIANNKCEKNVDSSGIYVYNGANPVLRNNLCTQNEKNGISVGSKGSNPQILQNTCTENIDSGILVYEAAGPTLKGNVCSNNGKIGIAYTPNCIEPKGNRWKKDNTTENNGIEDFVKVTISPKD